jgi:hypothetical protein
MIATRSPTEEELDALVALSREDIARLVLSLLVEEMLSSRLAAFRSQNVFPKPVKGSEELGLGRNDIMPISDGTGRVG